MAAKNIEGVRRGKLVAVSFTGKSNRTHCRLWNARCDCGADVVVPVAGFIRGGYKSCGCGTIEFRRKHLQTHGQSGTRPYRIWCNMLTRCTNVNTPNYARYGARGIRVCDSWLQSFEDFWEDMGEGYAEHLQLDRKNNNGPYSPANCKWSTRKEQTRNTRHNRYVTTPWGELIVKDAAKRIGIARSTLEYRLAQKWPRERLYTR